MSDLLSAQEEKLNKEAFGDFPFPFQTSDQIDELEVKSRMQAIDFYCKKCRKSMRISYALTGDRTAPAMNGFMIWGHDPPRTHEKITGKTESFRAFCLL